MKYIPLVSSICKHIPNGSHTGCSDQPAVPNWMNNTIGKLTVRKKKKNGEVVTLTICHIYTITSTYGPNSQLHICIDAYSIFLAFMATIRKDQNRPSYNKDTYTVHENI